MKVLLQRVTHAAVDVSVSTTKNGIIAGKIGTGLVVFVVIARVDVEQDIKYLSVACPNHK